MSFSVRNAIGGIGLGKLTIAIIYDNIKMGSGNYRELLDDNVIRIKTTEKYHENTMEDFCTRFCDDWFETHKKNGHYEDSSDTLHFMGIFQNNKNEIVNILYYSYTSFDWEQAKEDEEIDYDCYGDDEE